MPCRFPSHLLALLLAAALGCVTEYQPQERNLDAASLADAIRAVEDAEASIELREGGLYLTAYLYHWREPIPPSFYAGDPWARRAFDPPSQQRMRLISGPAVEVYLPYERIEKVEARSWPLWNGVEIGIGSGPDLAVEGPLVVEVGSREDAERLTDALETIRRAHVLSAAAVPEEPAAAD